MYKINIKPPRDKDHWQDQTTGLIYLPVCCAYALVIGESQNVLRLISDRDEAIRELEYITRISTEAREHAPEAVAANDARLH